jgi:hypothetical protein
MVEIIEVEEGKVGCVLHLATSDIWDSLYAKSGGIAFSYFSILQQKAYNSRDSNKIGTTGRRA